jgi:hypothetical protein
MHYFQNVASCYMQLVSRTSEPVSSSYACSPDDFKRPIDYQQQDCYFRPSRQNSPTVELVGSGGAHYCRSQWPRGLSYELSSPAQTLGSCVRIPLEAWMSVFLYSVFVLSCWQVAALRRADPPSKESYRLCRRSINWKKVKLPRPNTGLYSHR